MFQRKPRRFRRRSNGRNHGGKVQNRMGSHSFENGINRNNFRNSLSAERLFEKYISLAKEATSSGDKTLSENYLQHADHFKRVIEEKNKNREQNKVNVTDKTIDNNKTDKTIDNNKVED
tara:strand:+ start:455 stop:811 length:357 start_codon:yes stop_codon:yes gene_type:complete